ncbi:MAG: histidine--tRNA ligase [Candidatus Eisenbacteria bacterium]|nr:histidine--tRNA ligase [Candidatus Eisenbacteria bacterium]
MRYKAPRGTRDILPDDSWKWQHVERVFRDTVARSGYREIRTPVFEETELFARGIGDSTDIVRKEMYTFEDRKGRSLTLRPEGTAGAVRAFIEHSMGRGARLTKLYYFCPMFRYERPQAGRYRQFWQWGLEAIGSMNPAVDAEIIQLSVRLFERLGIPAPEAKVNSAGCPACTPAYNALLRETYASRIEEFCPDCRVRYERNPRRMFDCKVESCLEILGDAPSILQSLCDECAGHFEAVREHLTSMGVRHAVDTSMARGLDYYTKTVFEVHYGGLGAQSALCGGGRYDGLVEELGGPPTPACGVSGGVDRLISALEDQAVMAEGEPAPDVYLVSMGGRSDVVASRLATALRERVSVETDYQGRSLKAQMREAGKLGAKYVVIVGEDELSRGVAVVKDMASGEQRDVPVDQLAVRLFESVAAATTGSGNGNR